MRNTVVLLLLGSALVAIACTPSGRDDAADTGLAETGLANTSWTVASISGAPSLPGAQPTLRFSDDGTMGGSAGCNQYSGSFRTNGNAISITQTSSTMMACPGDQGPQETAFLAGLQGATTWGVGQDGNLVLSGTAEIVSEPGIAEGLPSEPPRSELAGTDWSLVDMGGTGDFAKLVPTLHFGLDGMVSGFSGCNKFSGPYTVTGGDLSLGSLATTKMACEPPASAVEAGVLAALAGVNTWSIDENGQLTLGGAVPLTLTRN
jgi:heat shock protein HslJ